MSTPVAGIHNEDVAAAFDELADILAIQDANPFRVRAYRRAAQVVRSCPHELARMHGERDYESLPGIGADLAAKIAEMIGTGRITALEKLRRQTPAGVRELLSLPGMGPARVRAVQKTLRVRGREDLERALAGGRLAKLRGFGPALIGKLKAALADAAAHGSTQRIPWTAASEYAQPLEAYLASLPGVIHAQVAGSYRRGRDTVGDLDVLACAKTGADPIAALARFADLRNLTAAGSTKAAGVLRNGLQVDVRVVGPESYGAALQYFTGSREHSIRLRRRAQERGLKLSEYGLFRGEARVAGETEEGVYRALGLPWIPPELREDRGEIEAAEHGALPELIERKDLVGDLHTHTNASDGHDSLAAMASAARAQDLAYLAITDHSKHLGVVHGLDSARLARQIDAIDALNAKRASPTLLKGAEVDILEDGSLALPDAMLARLDVVVIAIHSHFDLTEAKQTTRVLRALERPYVTILAHPSGRLLGKRPPYALDFEQVLTAARARPCYLEINAQPLRLDLDDVHIKAARDRGILLSIASDAHSVEQLGALEGGIRQARRGWARREDVLNARPLKELMSLLGATRR